MNLKRVANSYAESRYLLARCFWPVGGWHFTGDRFGPAGAAVPDLNVVIKNQATGATNNTVSGADGTFIFNAVEAATYDLTITAKAGFKTYSTKGIAVTPNERRDLGKLSLVTGRSDRRSYGHASARPYRPLRAKTRSSSKARRSKTSP